MLLKIRLAKTKRPKPYYRIVVIDSRKGREGRYLEKLGNYDPLDGRLKNLKPRENFIKWIKYGAEISKTIKKKIGKHIGDLGSIKKS